jgi:hypothetical protein
LRLRQQIQGVEQQLVEQLQEVQQQLAHKRVSCWAISACTASVRLCRSCPCFCVARLTTAPAMRTEVQP